MSNDVELVIGARNEAKAVFDELGAQLRALSVPASEGALKAEAAITGLAAAATRALASAAAAVLGTTGAVVGGIAAIGAGEAIISIYKEVEAVDALNRQLENYVGKSRIATSVHQDFAESIRQSLNVSEDETLALMTKANALGVTEDKLDDAALAAIGLSRSLGIDMDSALKKVINGDENLVSMLDSVNAGLMEQATEVEGIAGAWLLMQIETKKALEAALAATAPLQEMFKSIGSTIKETVLTGIVGATTAVEVFGDEFRSVVQLSAASFEYMMIGIQEDAKHAFTVQLPAYTIWFIDNTFNLFQDGFNAILTIFQNFNVAASKAIVLLWDFIASGGAGGLDKLTQDMLSAADTLLVGFEATAESIPEVMKRKLTEEESTLARYMSELAGSLGQTFTERFQKNMAAIDIATPQLDAKALELKQAAAAGTGSASQGSSLGATESRLLTRGRGEEIAKQQLAAQNATNEKLDQIARSVANGGLPLKTVGAKV